MRGKTWDSFWVFEVDGSFLKVLVVGQNWIILDDLRMRIHNLSWLMTIKRESGNLLDIHFHTVEDRVLWWNRFNLHYLWTWNIHPINVCILLYGSLSGNQVLHPNWVPDHSINLFPHVSPYTTRHFMWSCTPPFLNRYTDLVSVHDLCALGDQNSSLCVHEGSFKLSITYAAWLQNHLQSLNMCAQDLQLVVFTGVHPTRTWGMGVWELPMPDTP